MRLYIAALIVGVLVIGALYYLGASYRAAALDAYKGVGLPALTLATIYCQNHNCPSEGITQEKIDSCNSPQEAKACIALFSTNADIRNTCNKYVDAVENAQKTVLSTNEVILGIVGITGIDLIGINQKTTYIINELASCVNSIKKNTRS